MNVKIPSHEYLQRNILVQCECGQLGIRHHGWGNHLTEQVRMICRDCNKTMRVVNE